MLSTNKRVAILRTFLLIIAFGFNNTSFSQQKLLEVKDLNVTEYPKVFGTLWVRNPEGINTNGVDFIEDEKTVKPVFMGKQPVTDSVAKNKCIVFLILNPGSYGRSELEWYKNVIKNAIRKGTIKKGDKIEVLDFNNEANSQLLYPNSIRFTDDTATIFKKLDAISLRDIRCLCSSSNNRSLIYQAVNHTLDLLEKENLKIPAGVFVLADDRACLPGSSGETPGLRSKRLNIPLFGINYNKPDQINSIKMLCEESFGIYYSDPFNSVLNSSSKLEGFLSNFLQRQAGFYYKFSYNATFEKDGAQHLVKINSKSDNSAFFLPVPSKNLIEWIQANPILFAILFLFFGALVFLTLLLLKNNKKKKGLEKEVQAQKMSEIDRKHKENEEMLSAKLSSQQNELDGIKKKEQIQKEAELRKKTEAENQKNEAELIGIMRLAGNFPWFDYSAGDKVKSRFEIRKPEIVVGRAGNCDLPIDLPTISKKHFQLSFNRSGQYWIKDLGSSNGLYVNGQRVTQIQLRHGDFIQIGEVVINFFI